MKNALFAKPGQLMSGFLTCEKDLETILKIVGPFRIEIFLLSVIANMHYSGTSVIFKHFRNLGGMMKHIGSALDCTPDIFICCNSNGGWEAKRIFSS